MRANLWRVVLTGTLLTSIVIILVAGGIGAASPETVFAVDPKIVVAGLDESFIVNITVSDVSDLYGWQFNLTFDPTIVNVVNVTEGPFLKQAGSTWMPDVTIHNFVGWVFSGDSLFPFPEEGATGSGVLASVLFNVTAEGESDLNLSETVLTTYEPTEPEPIALIDHTSVNGLFASDLLRDVAVIGVEVSSTSVTAGDLVFINVTVKNEGEATETFDVTVSYDSTIETKTATGLAPEASEILSFSWDTKGLTEGNYTITAVARTLSGETDIADNTYPGVDVAVTVAPFTIPTELFVGIIIVVIVACAVIFLYLRGRRSTKA